MPGYNHSAGSPACSDAGYLALIKKAWEKYLNQETLYLLAVRCDLDPTHYESPAFPGFTRNVLRLSKRRLGLPPVVMLPILFPNRFRRNNNRSVPDDTLTTPKSLGEHGKAQRSRVVQHEATFEVLTDDVLLEIFHWYRQTSMEQCGTWGYNQWIVLVHVSKRWRNIVFDSSSRLDLWLLCTYGTPGMRRKLDCWPSLPIVIKYWPNSMFEPFKPPSHEDEENIIAALEHPDRVHAIQLAVTSSLWEKVAERMQVPFPSLTFLSLWLDPGTAQSHPMAFLAGVASPCLKGLSLVGVPFPRSWRLLASANDLVALRLLEVPGAGYIAPDMMATYLSMLPHLKLLCIIFHSPPSDHYSRGHKPTATLVTRTSLPSLTHFNFRGTNEYLKDFMSRIDAPFLNEVNVTPFNQVNFNVPHLSRSIDQMEMPNTPGALSCTLSLRIICPGTGWQTSCLMAPFFSNVEGHLEIRADCIRNEKQMDSIAWLEFFYSFSSIGRLRISGEMAPQHVAPALEGVGEELIRQVFSRNCVRSCSSDVRTLHRLNTSLPQARNRVDL